VRCIGYVASFNDHRLLKRFGYIPPVDLEEAFNRRQTEEEELTMSARRPAHRMPVWACAVLLFCLLSASCAADPYGPAPNLPPPPLEPIDFEVIGSGKVLFQRIAGGGSVAGVYLIDADARRSTSALDTVRSAIFGPSISPDGRRVAWQRWTDSASCYDVYTTDLSGAQARRLSSTRCNSEGAPSWTAMGTAVAFIIADLPHDWGIYQYMLDTGSLIPVRTFTTGPGGVIECPSIMRTLVFDLVSVSANGGLAYSCFGGEIIVAEGPTDSLVSRYRAESATQVYAPTWSPDGRELAFLELRRGAADLSSPILSTSLKVLEPASGSVRTIAIVEGSGSAWWHSANTVSVCWLAGGAKLVFNGPSPRVEDQTAIRANLYVVGADGTGLVRLTTAADAFDHSVSCSS
jgi:hypothetical protein